MAPPRIRRVDRVARIVPTHRVILPEMRRPVASRRPQVRPAQRLRQQCALIAPIGPAPVAMTAVRSSAMSAAMTAVRSNAMSAAMNVAAMDMTNDAAMPVRLVAMTGVAALRGADPKMPDAWSRGIPLRAKAALAVW